MTFCQKRLTHVSVRWTEGHEYALKSKQILRIVGLTDYQSKLACRKGPSFQYTLSYTNLCIVLYWNSKWFRHWVKSGTVCQGLCKNSQRGSYHIGTSTKKCTQHWLYGCTWGISWPCDVLFTDHLQFHLVRLHQARPPTQNYFHCWLISSLFSRLIN